MFYLYLAVFLLAAFWYLFVDRKPKGAPPGPPFKLPVLGQLLYRVAGNEMECLRLLRKKYDIDLRTVDSP